MKRLMQVVLATVVSVGAGGAGLAEAALADTTPPTITITAPVDQQHYAFGTSINASYTCADEAGGSGIATCTNTTPVDTTPGTHTFTVMAADKAGNTASKSVTYTVDPMIDTTAPTITITSPIDGQHYAYGTAITGNYSCDDPGGSGVATCTNPTPILVGTAGTHTFTVNATDNAGNPATKSVTYTIDPAPADTTPPTITITSPINGQHYGPGVFIAGTYSCDDGAGAGVATCANAAPVDTTPGPHVYTIDATDRAGNAARKSVTYVVDPPGGGPPVPIPAVSSPTTTVARVTLPARASLAALRTGVTLSLADLKPNSSVEVRVRRGTRTLRVYKTRANSAGKAKLKLRLSRTQLRSLRGKALTLRYAVTTAGGKKRVATRTLKVT